MSNHWRDFYSKVDITQSLFKQVGKTVNGQDVTETQLNLIVTNLIDVLSLHPEDSVIDLCCGNGLIAKKLSEFVDEIQAVDLSPKLLEVAKQYNSSKNIRYIESDILSLRPEFFLGTKKVILYEALQFLSVEDFSILISLLDNLSVGSLIYLGGIPNLNKLRNYYDTDEKYAYYLQCESKGKPHLGRWWLMDEINTIAYSSGFTATLLAQNKGLYTSYYRFDVLLKKIY